MTSAMWRWWLELLWMTTYLPITPVQSLNSTLSPGFPGPSKEPRRAPPANLSAADVGTMTATRTSTFLKRAAVEGALWPPPPVPVSLPPPEVMALMFLALRHNTLGRKILFIKICYRKKTVDYEGIYFLLKNEARHSVRVYFQYPSAVSFIPG